MMQFTLKFTSGVCNELSGLPDDTLAQVLEEKQLFKSGFEYRFFFMGKEIAQESTLAGAGIRDGSKVICLMRKNNTPAPVIPRIRRLKPAEIRQQVINKEGARIIDRHYNAYEMNVRKEIVFKAALEKQNLIEHSKNDDIKFITNLEYTPEISETPLPFAFTMEESLEESLDADFDDSFNVSNPLTLQSSSSSNLD